MKSWCVRYVWTFGLLQKGFLLYPHFKPALDISQITCKSGSNLRNDWSGREFSRPKTIQSLLAPSGALVFREAPFNKVSPLCGHCHHVLYFLNAAGSRISNMTFPCVMMVMKTTFTFIFLFTLTYDN